MLTAERLDQTLSAIYDTALDETALPAALQSMAGLFSCHFADAYRRARDYSVWQGVQVGLDEVEYQTVFLGHWALMNVWGKRRPPVRAGDIVTTQSVMTKSELKRSVMYVDYLDQRSLHQGLRFDIWADDGWVEDFSFLRSWAAGPYSSDELRAAALLMPHLRRVAALRRRTAHTEGLASAGLSALEHVRMGMMLLGRDGRLLHANAAGVALLRTGRIKIGPDGVSAGSGTQMRALRAMIHAATGTVGGVDSSAGGGAQSGSLRVMAGPDGAALSVVALPVRRDGMMTWGGANAAVLLCIIDRGAEASASAARLTALFGLTPAEAMLATKLCGGQDVREIADATQRSVNTVRSLLTRLMAKTDTNRQSELVRLLSMVP